MNLEKAFDRRNEVKDYIGKEYQGKKVEDIIVVPTFHQEDFINAYFNRGVKDNTELLKEEEFKSKDFVIIVLFERHPNYEEWTDLDSFLEGYSET